MTNIEVIGKIWKKKIELHFTDQLFFQTLLFHLRIIVIFRFEWDSLKYWVFVSDGYFHRSGKPRFAQDLHPSTPTPFFVISVMDWVNRLVAGFILLWDLKKKRCKFWKDVFWNSVYCVFGCVGLVVRWIDGGRFTNADRHFFISWPNLLRAPGYVGGWST